jgi:hypothetical protein
MSKQPIAATGSSFSIVLLILPIALIGWALVNKVQFPFNQLEYLKLAGAISTGSFVIAWYFSFWQIRRDKVIIQITLFLFLLWTFGITLGIANANRMFDQSPVRTKLRKVVATRTVGNAGGQNSSKSYCIATFEKPLEGKEDVQIKYDECGSIRIAQDGLEIQLREGAFGLPWKSQHAVVRDFDLYRERLGL